MYHVQQLLYRSGTRGPETMLQYLLAVRVERKETRKKSVLRCGKRESGTLKHYSKFHESRLAGRMPNLLRSIQFKAAGVGEKRNEKRNGYYIHGSRHVDFYILHVTTSLFNQSAAERKTSTSENAETGTPGSINQVVDTSDH